MNNAILTLGVVTLLVGSAHAALVTNLTAASGTGTTVDGAVVSTWSDGATTFTRSGSDARYVADSGGGIAAIDFDRSAPFLGDISASNGAATIGDATVLVWAKFDGYSHSPSNSSYYFSIDGTGNEQTLGRDLDAGGDNAIYSWDGSGATYGNQSPLGWNLYIARYYGASLAGSTSAEAWIDTIGDGAVVLGAADLTNGDSTAYSGNANAVRIGSWTNGGSGLDGQIRALQIYNTILSDSEIQAAASAITGVPEPSTSIVMIISLIGSVTLRRIR